MADKQKKQKPNFLVQGTILAVAGIITRLIGMVYKIPLTNIAGDEGIGYYGVAFQIYGIALMLTSYSLPLAVSKLVSARVSTGQYKNAYRVFRGAMVVAIVGGGLVSLGIFFGAGFISDNIMHMSLSIYALRVLAPCLFIVAILGVLRGFFQGYGTMMPTAISQILEQIINAIVSIVGALMLLKVGRGMASGADKESYGAAFAAAGGTLGTVMGALSALLFVLFVFGVYKGTLKRQMARDRSKHIESNRKIIKILLLTLAPVILSSTVYNVVGILDSAMYTNVMAAQGMAEKEYSALLGLITVPYDTLTNIPLSVASSLAAAFVPSLVATLQSGDRRQMHSKINMVSRFNMMLAIPCAVGFIVLAQPIVDLLFTSENNNVTAMLLRMGAISVVFFCLSTVTNSALQGLDKLMLPVKNAAISLAIHMAALYIMLVAFKWGVYSIVLSKIIFAGAICILNAHDLREAIHYVQERKKSFVIPTIASVIMGVVTLGVHLLFTLFAGEKIATVAAIFAALFSYCISLVALGGITEKELLSAPKGDLLIKILRKLHLLREDSVI